jgi:small subunit ribosomal protein S9
LPTNTSATAKKSHSIIEYYGTGRRKRAVARVYLREGAGTVTVNRKTIEAYFPNDMLKLIVRQPLVLTETVEKFNVLVNVQGGGAAGQAGAIRLGVARALLDYNPEFRKRLKVEGLLTRDPRQKERKKYGQPGARKRFQYSKR